MRIVARWSVLVLLLMAASQAEAADKVLPQELEESVTRTIEEELRETRAPGAAVAIVRDGEVVYLRAFGVRSIEERTPVTPDTLFRLGSTTKSVRRGYGSHIRFLPERRGAVIALSNENGVTLHRSVDRITKAVFGLPDEPPRNEQAEPLTAAQAERYTGTYVHADLAKFTVTWDGKRLVLKTDKEYPLERTGPDTFQTEDHQGLAFVDKPGQTRAKYLHMDLLSAIRAGK
ncbi:serine hydrolase domain-containing protein [Archangium lansingense]|uniref:Serine hydrolase n=1 Tax=Archangium lansingense TaxID=2995310 RepID=A0ABT4A3A7_9BACT|nr:serine hydrolase domain-containing protein [Archangium lansinium]MCY1076128.1 serine hydrolase [Archangium lansinium]